MKKPGKGSTPEDRTLKELGDLSERLKDLSGRIAAEKSERAESQKPPASLSGATSYAKGYRLASEFVAGTLVGGLFGYGFDWLFGTLPFGLIVFLLLGFGAGILNMARAANRVPPAQERLGSNPPPTVAVMGIMSAVACFWTLPTAILSGTAAAAGIAWINSVGNLGGYVSPFVIGRLRELTHSMMPALVFLAISLCCSGLLTLVVARPTQRSDLV